MARPTYTFLWANNATTTLDGSLASGATTATVADGSVFGTGHSTTKVMKATIDDGTNVEVVHITNVATNTLTIVRAQDGTTSPASFADGTTIEVRVTADALAQITPVLTHDPAAGSYLGVIEIGRESDTDARYAIAIGERASAATGKGDAASHYYQIAFGFEAEAIQNASIAIGYQAKANSASTADVSAIAIGDQVRAVGRGAIVIGRGDGSTNGEASADDAIAIGPFAASTGTASIAIGWATDVLNSKTNAVVLGALAQCDSNEGVAIGYKAETAGNSAMAVGQESISTQGGAAIGDGAVSASVGGTALGRQRRSWHVGTFKSQPQSVTREHGDWSPTQECDHLYSSPQIFAFPPMDLGSPQSWAASTTFSDQEVVEPTTPAGTEQFYLAIGATAALPGDSWYDGDAFTNNESTEGVTEPTWVTTTQGDLTAATAANSRWVYINPQAGVQMDVTQLQNSTARYKFVPTRIGFYCWEITGTHTTKPTFDFGNETSNTAYFTAKQVDLITADNQMQWWDVAGDGTMVPGADDLKITLTTPGDGLLFMGRFIVHGILMTLRG